MVLANAAPSVHPITLVARCRGAKPHIVSGKVSSEVAVLLFIQAAHITSLLRAAANAQHAQSLAHAASFANGRLLLLLLLRLLAWTCSNFTDPRPVGTLA